MKKNYLLIGFLILSYSAYSLCESLITVDIKPPTPLTNTAKLTIKNNDLFPRIVLVKIFNANEDVLIAEISTTVDSKQTQIIDVQPSEKNKFKSILSWKYFNIIGDIRKPNKDNNFRIPFLSNYNVTVCQSSDGTQSTHIEDRVNAVDFCTKEKTPIVAAKDGTVINVVQNFTESGVDPSLIKKANEIQILHDDGLISSYVHIFTNSSLVNIGDKVKRGQQIALVGSVGYSSGPHLHFEVLEGLSKLNNKNELRNVIPIKFFNIDNEEIKIISGSIYDVNGIILKNKEPKFQSKIIKKDSEKICEEISSKTDKDKAIDCYSKSQYENAILHFEKHTNKFPNDSLSLARLAISYTRLDRHNEAVIIYRKALDKNWISYDFASLYARSLFAIGEKEEAIKWNKKAITLAPNCNDCRRDLAIQLKDMNRKKEAYDLLNSYDEKQKELGKPQYFQGLLILLKD